MALIMFVWLLWLYYFSASPACTVHLMKVIEILNTTTTPFPWHIAWSMVYLSVVNTLVQSEMICLQFLSLLIAPEAKTYSLVFIGKLLRRNFSKENPKGRFFSPADKMMACFSLSGDLQWYCINGEVTALTTQQSLQCFHNWHLKTHCH